MKSLCQLRWEISGHRLETMDFHDEIQDLKDALRAFGGVWQEFARFLNKRANEINIPKKQFQLDAARAFAKGDVVFRMFLQFHRILEAWPKDYWREP